MSQESLRGTHFEAATTRFEFPQWILIFPADSHFLIFISAGGNVPIVRGPHVPIVRGPDVPNVEGPNVPIVEGPNVPIVEGPNVPIPGSANR